ncbi:MAG: Holliday junction branch migration protein RuvA [Bacteroidales bacterium]|nr:Holliday junction branch migration protein RuvA [Bacteroidales bacterium]
MYEYITGSLEEITPTDAIVEACGVGYDLLISLSTFSKLQNDRGKAVKIYTYHLVREDDESLFGFADKAERAVFVQLISVSGVGPGSARMILSAMTADEVKEAVLTGDVNKFKAVKGIGLKTAQRVIIDLKDKIGKGGGEIPFETATAVSPVRDEALGALTMLGFAKPAVEKTLDKLLKEKSDYTVEELIKRALKMM